MTVRAEEYADAKSVSQNETETESETKTECADESQDEIQDEMKRYREMEQWSVKAPSKKPQKV